MVPIRMSGMAEVGQTSLRMSSVSSSFSVLLARSVGFIVCCCFSCCCGGGGGGNGGGKILRM